MNEQIYSIYSHADTDGGIAAAIFGRHILEQYGKFGWKCNIIPVNHGANQVDWALVDIQWPCAILDFTLHPQLLNERFYTKELQTSIRLGGADKVPPCVWIDHHPTGSSYTFLNAHNLKDYMPRVLSKWDVSAISTPGLMRTHYKDLGLPLTLLEEYEDLIDLAEIIDGALFANADAAHDFSSDAIRLQTLFTSSHPAVNRDELYKKLVHHIIQNASVEDLLDVDPIFKGLIDFERKLHSQQMRSYLNATTKIGRVALSNFWNAEHFSGLGKFVPYILHPEVEYAIHIMPRKDVIGAISCGINPWNKPTGHDRHLGNYFAKHFNGGGHAFVAGGKVSEENLKSIEDLISFINFD